MKNVSVLDKHSPDCMHSVGGHKKDQEHVYVAARKATTHHHRHTIMDLETSSTTSHSAAVSIEELLLWGLCC